MKKYGTAGKYFSNIIKPDIWKSKTALIIILILTASAIRSAGLGTRPWFNDELSALYRLENKENLQALVNESVKPDAHPAGIQVFLWYWADLVNDNPFLLRLPFAMAGILAVWLLFLLGDRWFGRTAAWLAAVTLALLQFPVIFSQLIRPYSTGMLFIMAAAWSWDKLLFNSSGIPLKRKIYYAAAMTCSFTLAMYNHYFSFLMAGVIGITGLFLIRKHNILLYFASGFVSLILFLPHLKISLVQVARGGLALWLPPPHKTWIPEHVLYLFNDSWWLMVMILAPCAVMLTTGVLKIKNRNTNIKLIICLLWYLIPLVFAYVYSITVNPILQNSIMLFAFPFLLLALFAGFGNNKTLPVKAFSIVLPLLMGSQLILGNNYYKSVPYTDFKKAAGLICDSQHAGSPSCWSVDVNDPWYIHKYLDKECKPDSAVFYLFKGHESIPELNEKLGSLNCSSFSYTSLRPADPIVSSVIRQHFPYLVSYNNQYPYSEFFRFSRYKTGIDLSGYTRDSILLAEISDGDNPLIIDTTITYFPVFEGLLPGNSCGRGRVLLHCEIKTAKVQSPSDINIVIHPVNKNGTSGEWFGIKIGNTRTKNNSYFYTVLMPTGFNINQKIKCYLWNPGHEFFSMEQIRLLWLKDNAEE